MHELEGMIVGGDSGAPWITFNEKTQGDEIAGIMSQSVYSSILATVAEMIKNKDYLDIRKELLQNFMQNWPIYNIAYSVYPHLEWIKENMVNRWAYTCKLGIRISWIERWFKKVMINKKTFISQW